MIKRSYIQETRCLQDRPSVGPAGGGLGHGPPQGQRTCDHSHSLLSNLVREALADPGVQKAKQVAMLKQATPRPANAAGQSASLNHPRREEGESRGKTTRPTWIPTGKEWAGRPATLACLARTDLINPGWMWARMEDRFLIRDCSTACL